MFAPAVMVIKMYVKNGSFFVFSNKKLVTEKDISAPERSVWVLSMNDMVNRNM